MRSLNALLIAALVAPVGLQSQGDESSLPTSAPKANLAGLIVGFDPLVYAAFRGEYLAPNRTPGGYGLALRFGYAFTPRVAMVLDVPVTDLVVSDSANYLLSHGDVVLRYTPKVWYLKGRAIAPFAQAGVSLVDISATVQPNSGPAFMYDLAGEALALGAGVSMFVRPNLAVTWTLAWADIEFNDERVGNVTTHRRGIAGSSWRTQFGFDWRRAKKNACR